MFCYVGIFKREENFKIVGYSVGYERDIYLNTQRI
jgi:hypothetical protein